MAGNCLKLLAEKSLKYLNIAFNGLKLLKMAWDDLEWLAIARIWLRMNLHGLE